MYVTERIFVTVQYLFTMYMNDPSAIRRNVRLKRLSLSKLYNKILEPNKETYEENVYVYQLCNYEMHVLHSLSIRYQTFKFICMKFGTR